MAATVYVHGPAPIAPPFGRVLVAKTTHIGDLVISLPLAAALKRRDPHCTVIYLTSAATAEVARCCPAIDEVVTMPAEPAPPDRVATLLESLCLNIFIQVNNWRLLAMAAQLAAIPIRIGSLFRLFNWFHCTHLVAIGRATSGLNKRELDLHYLAPLGIGVPDRHTLIRDGQLALPPPPLHHMGLGQVSKFRHVARGRHAILLSPAAATAASHCWPPESYAALIDSLDRASYHWFICGLGGERQQMQALLRSQAGAVNVTDLVGKLALPDFLGLIAAADGVVGGNSGPVHLAAALGVRTLGLYQSRATDILRWQPLGSRVTVLHSEVRCRGERRARRARQRGKPQLVCPCIAAIRPQAVAQAVAGWFDEERMPSPSLEGSQ